VGMAGVPTTTQFSITADPVPIDTPSPEARTTAPSDSRERSPMLGRPMTTADDAIRGATSPRSTAGTGARVLLTGVVYTTLLGASVWVATGDYSDPVVPGGPVG
jgi:hypothetical protein